jgi:hypothetical protein
MSFDCLGDVFGTLGLDMIARKVEGRQRPVILDGVGKSDDTRRTGSVWGVSQALSCRALVFAGPTAGPALWEDQLPNVVGTDV